MREARILPIMWYGLLLSVIMIAVADAAWAGSRYTVLYSFQGGNDGAGPYAALLWSGQGRLYGTTSGGGLTGVGTVFELARQPSGNWNESLLHSFEGRDGSSPNSSLVLDSAGNLYGTTSLGGENLAGTVFSLSPSHDAWTETTIYDFCSEPNCEDGGGPVSPVILDGLNIYGTTKGGGALYGGVAFQLTPTDSGWSEQVVHAFDGENQGKDGSTPVTGLTLNRTGSLYGTTEGGGTNGAGTVFRLRPIQDGTWKEVELHGFPAFTGDGRVPSSGVVLDGKGNLYGVTQQGGRNRCGQAGCGTLFKLTKQPNGHWKETVLHNFAPGKGGSFPAGNLAFDGVGNIYGVTGGGGAPECSCGVIYKLSANPDGTGTYTVLHRFHGLDGAVPAGGLIKDNKSRFYGTTILGGTADNGTIFEIKP